MTADAYRYWLWDTKLIVETADFQVTNKLLAHKADIPCIFAVYNKYSLFSCKPISFVRPDNLYKDFIVWKN